MKKEEQVIAEFWNLFNKKIWLDEIEMKAALKDYKLSEIHCIEYIGKNADSNVTKLAESFYMTRSAISKIAKKLMEKGLIESYQKPENKKEIYFRLTERGEDVNNIHEKLHQKFQNRDQGVFTPVTEEQLDMMIRFAQRYNQHLDEEIEKLGINIAARTCDKL